MSEQELVACPACEGNGGGYWALVDFSDGHGELRAFVCRLCQGSHRVTTAQRAHYLGAKAVRDARRAKGQSIGDAAKERGMTLAEYSEYERGYNCPD